MGIRSRKPFIYITLASILLIVLGFSLSHPSSSKSSQKINIVATENFWGNLVAQIGGDKVNVLSVISDPNADPHEYESNTNDARAFANSSYVVVNGAGYDSWANKLLSSNPSSNRKVLSVAELVGKREGDNPHFWYSPTYVNMVVKQINIDLSKIDPHDSNYFNNNLTTLQSALGLYQSRLSDISKYYSGTNVGSTEDIFTYMAQAADLNLISPSAFTQAVSEGNDPPTNSVVDFQQQLTNKQVKIMVYNKQTETPLTNNMKKLANNQNIPVVGVTETIQPANLSFQSWMNNQVIYLQNALNLSRAGQ